MYDYDILEGKSRRSEENRAREKEESHGKEERGKKERKYWEKEKQEQKGKVVQSVNREKRFVFKT